ncbi:MAG: hypothetical protein WB988_13665, partial [Candidatus Nitrosopolaris sp.]
MKSLRIWIILVGISTTYITGTYTTFISRLVSPRRSKTGKVTVEKRLYVYVIVMSASSHTMNRSLPPNSSTHFFIC